MTCPEVLEVFFPMLSSPFGGMFGTLPPSKLKILMGKSTVQDPMSLRRVRRHLMAGKNSCGGDMSDSCVMKEWLKASVTNIGK